MEKTKKDSKLDSKNKTGSRKKIQTNSRSVSKKNKMTKEQLSKQIEELEKELYLDTHDNNEALTIEYNKNNNIACDLTSTNTKKKRHIRVKSKNSTGSPQKNRVITPINLASKNLNSGIMKRVQTENDVNSARRIYGGDEGKNSKRKDSKPRNRSISQNKQERIYIEIEYESSKNIKQPKKKRTQSKDKKSLQNLSYGVYKDISNKSIRRKLSRDSSIKEKTSSRKAS